MTPQQQEQIVALGRNPVSDASPVGEPVRYDEIFEQLQAQMDRIASLSGEEVNWRTVVELSTEILKNKSKDLLVMTYLTLGLFETEGYAGLVAGFDAYRELLAKFWEGCFPKIKPPQGRYNALQYLSDKILAVVELKGGQAKRMPQANEKEAVHKCADACAALDAAVATAFTAQPESPNMIPLTRAFKALKEKVGPLVTAPPPGAAAAPAGEGAAAAPGGGAVAAPSGGGGGVAIPDQFKNATQAIQAIKAVAKYFIGQDNKDATGYRLMRTAMFGPIAEPPKDKIIPGPPPQRRQFFENLASSGNWPQLLTEAEGQFATTPLWLDLQRFAALALKGLGPAYKAAHDAVVLEIVALQGRMPALFDVSFKEGAPFADGATRAWLDEAAASSGGGGGGGAGRGRGAAGDAVDAAVAGSKKLLAESKPLDAIGLLSAQAAASGAGRDRFRAQLALGTLCLDMGKLPLAQSILEGLETLIDQYRLEDWEPALTAKALYDLHECLAKSKPKPTPEEAARLQKVFARLARLDPAAALKIDAAKKA